MAKKNNSDFIDISGLLKLYLKNWYMFAISVTVFLGIGLAYAFMYLPKYSVNANLLINPEEDAMPGMASGLSSLFGSEGYVEDEIFIVSSHTVYREVARDLKLNISYLTDKNIFAKQIDYPKHPVELTPQGGIMDTLRSGITFKLSIDKNGKASISGKMKRSTVVKVKDVTLPYVVTTPLGKFAFSKTADYPAGKKLNLIIGVQSYDSAAEDMAENISAEIASKRSNVITLNTVTTNPDYGMAILNAVMEKYNEKGIEQKNDQNRLTAKFLSERIDILSDELSSSEGDLESFKQRNELYDIAQNTGYTFSKKATYEGQLVRARTEAEIIKMTQDFLNAPENAYSLVPVMTDNEALSLAIQNYNDNVLQLMDLMQSAHPDNSMVKRLREQIDTMRANILTSIGRTYATTAVRINDLEREMNSADSKLSHLPAQERELRKLNRDLTVKQQLFIFLLQQREQTALQLATAFPKGTTVDKAFTLSRPVGMGKKAIALFALFLGLLIPPIILFIRQMLNDRFETRQDVENITDVPILGEMCTDRSGNRMVVSAESTSSTAELFRLMRSNLLFVLNDPNDRVVLITSSTSGEGKSFISINLAASLSLLNKRVVLVGMDIRKPQLANYLNISPKFGLTQYLSSSAVTLDQIITPLEDTPGLDVIVAGPIPPNPAELLISQKIDDLVSELRKRYDYVILDTAPIGLVSDTFTLNRVTDASIYVCRANYTSVKDLEEVNRIYDNNRLKKLSIVVNGTASKKSYGYSKDKDRVKA